MMGGGGLKNRAKFVSFISLSPLSKGYRILRSPLYKGREILWSPHLTLRSDKDNDTKAIFNIHSHWPGSVESFCFELLHVNLKVSVELIEEISSKRHSRENKLNICHKMFIFEFPIKFDFVIPPIRDLWNFMIPPKNW